MPDSVAPLSRASREKALAIVGQDKRLKPLLKGRNRVVLVERNLHDLARPRGHEQIVVAIYDYKKGRSVVALVDPRQSAVLGVEEVAAHFQLSPEERREAEDLAMRDERVGGFLGGRKPNPLTRLYFPPRGRRDDPPHRYAIVFLRPSASERRYAVVDLFSQAVVEFLETLTG